MGTRSALSEYATSKTTGIEIVTFLVTTPPPVAQLEALLSEKIMACAPSPIPVITLVTEVSEDVPKETCAPPSIE